MRGVVHEQRDLDPALAVQKRQFGIQLRQQRDDRDAAHIGGYFAGRWQ